MTIHSKLVQALRKTPLLERDAATADLALQYAKILDRLFRRLQEPEAVDSPTHHRRVISEIDTVGRRLESTLDRLGMSPGARPAVRGSEHEGGSGVPDAAALDTARADAAGSGDASGLDYAAAVDPAVTAADAGE